MYIIYKIWVGYRNVSGIISWSRLYNLVHILSSICAQQSIHHVIVLCELPDKPILFLHGGHSTVQPSAVSMLQVCHHQPQDKWFLTRWAGCTVQTPVPDSGPCGLCLVRWEQYPPVRCSVGTFMCVRVRGLGLGTVRSGWRLQTMGNTGQLVGGILGKKTMGDIP